MIGFRNSPDYVVEFVIAVFISLGCAFVYSKILSIFSEHRKHIIKCVNILLAVGAWLVLLYERTIQPQLELLQISNGDSKLFYIAVAFAIATMVHAYVDDK